MGANPRIRNKNMSYNINAGLLAAVEVLRCCGKLNSQAEVLQYAIDRNPTPEMARLVYDAGLDIGSTILQRKAIDYLEGLDFDSIGPPKPGKPKNNIYVPIPDRLCYIMHNALPYSSGGYATRGHGVALGLRHQGFDVTVVTRPGFPIDLPGYEYHNRDNAITFIDGMEYHNLLAFSRNDYANWEYTNKATEALVNKFRALRPETVVAASNNLTSLPALLAARRLGIPFHYEVRGFWEITRVSREPEYIHSKKFANQKRFEVMVAQAADHVFTLTNPMREELLRRGVSNKRITLVPNSCNPNHFVPRSRDAKLMARYAIPQGVPVIGYIGSFVQYEGLEDLVRACAILHAKGQDFRLLLVGNENASGQTKGPIMTAIENLTRNSGYGDKILMPGRIAPEDVAAHYSIVDIAPFPRKPQPVTEMVSPMKPLEALSMEKAVIVSSVRALVEMVKDGETGLVFQKGDISDMARALDQLIKSPDLRRRLGEQGRRWVIAERTWERTTGLFANQLRRHVAKHRMLSGQGDLDHAVQAAIL